MGSQPLRSVEGRIIFFRYMIFFTNIVCWLLAAAVFGLAMWIRFEENFQEWVIEMDFQHYWHGVYFMMIASALVMVVSFFGCCGAVQESPCMLYTFVVILLILFTMEFGGAAYVLNNGIEKANLYPWLVDRFRRMINEYDYNPRARRIINIIQEYIGCCGAKGTGDYDSVHKPVPDTCREHNTGNAYVDGCAEVFSWYLETKTGWICGVALFLCIFQIALIIMSCWLAISIRKDRRDYDRVPQKR